MPRIRSIKPEFFDDPDIAELSPFARLLFIGLWTQADREGRLPDEPRRLKARLFPFDDININDLLIELAAHQFILRYSDAERGFIAVRTFVKHQRPHPKEPTSLIPAAVSKNGEPVKDTASKVGSCTMVSGSLSLDTLEIRTVRTVAPRQMSTNGNGHKRPKDNQRVITRLIHTILDDPTQPTGFADLLDVAKTACAQKKLLYNSETVGAALESAMAQRQVKVS